MSNDIESLARGVMEAAALEHFQEKACPGPDPGWEPVFRPKMRPRKKTRVHSASSKAECTLVHRLRLIHIEAEHRLASYLARSNPDRPAASAAARTARPRLSVASHVTPSAPAQPAQASPASSGGGAASPPRQRTGDRISGRE
jgi:hypothetical protein